MTKWQLPDTALTMDEAAKYLGVSPSTFRQCYKAEGVPSELIGGWRYFFTDELDQWRRKNPTRLVGLSEDELESRRAKMKKYWEAANDPRVRTQAE